MQSHDDAKHLSFGLLLEWMHEQHHSHGQAWEEIIQIWRLLEIACPISSIDCMSVAAFERYMTMASRSRGADGHGGIGPSQSRVGPMFVCSVWQTIASTSNNNAKGVSVCDSIIDTKKPCRPHHHDRAGGLLLPRGAESLIPTMTWTWMST
jgi:hypothetical protein